MKAVVYDKSIPRYVAMKLLGPKRCARMATAKWGGLCPVSVGEVPEKPLPTQEWVRVIPRLAGICGSDLSVVCAQGSPYFSPLTSTPFVLGHEVVGVVGELGGDVGHREAADELSPLSVGDRVILEPALGCRARQINPMCPACRRGQGALCRNVTRGIISAGIQTGYCRDTGGAWSGGFVAHRTQLYSVPDEVGDSAAVLAEPLACALHGARRVRLQDDQTVLVVGCGSIGLLTVAALRAEGFKGRIVAVAKHGHQRRHALDLGADVLLDPPGAGRVRERYRDWADALGAEMHFPELGKPTVVGGVDVTFDCIGSSASIDDCIRFTVAGGRMVLIGMPGIPSNVDWTGIWYKELSLHAAYAYGVEHSNRSAEQNDSPKHTCQIALEILKSWGERLSKLVSEPYELTDYRRALRSALFTGDSGAVKTVFGIST